MKFISLSLTIVALIATGASEAASHADHTPHVAHLCDSTDPSYTDQLSVDSNLFHDALAIAGVKAGRACIAYEAMLQTGHPMHLIAENIHCYEARLIYFKLQARKNEYDYQYQQRVERGGR